MPLLGGGGLVFCVLFLNIVSWFLSNEVASRLLIVLPSRFRITELIGLYRLLVSKLSLNYVLCRAAI